MGKLPKLLTMTCFDALGKLKAVWSTENWTKNNVVILSGPLELARL